MQCFVYRSRRKPGAFLFVADKDMLAELPAPLLSAFGQPEFSFEFELTPDRSLARADAKTVMQALVGQGYYLQMPPQDSLDEVRLD
ncbi:MAG TPA: YcgL domain-containing protein [Gammaproteobacteria bacterium]|nr:YcgL domain-containing protein [Gammaproteobacteria bacterium]